MMVALAAACTSQVSGTRFSSSLANYYILTPFNTGVGATYFTNATNGTAGATVGAAVYDAGLRVTTDGLGHYVTAGFSVDDLGGTEFAMWRWNNDGTIDTTW